MKYVRCAILLLVALAVSPGLTALGLRELVLEHPVSPRPGVTVRFYTLDEPRKMAVYVARIDLARPGITFTGTERDARWGDEMPDFAKYFRHIETSRETTADFMARRRAGGCNVEIAVNTSGFGPWEYPFNHQYASFAFWTYVDGVQLSNIQKPKNAYFVVRRDGAIQIRDDVKPSEAKDISIAMFGNGLVLKNGEQAFPDAIPPGTCGDNIMPRTVLGLTADKKELVIVVVDGRQPGYSDGARYPELVDILKGEGVWDAINVDGGGSSSLVVYDRSSGYPVMLNHQPNDEHRKVGLNLGIVFDDSLVPMNPKSLERSASNYHSYEFADVKDTPPPEGYTPFYVSHYGRHGSRQLIGQYLPNTLKALEDANSANRLTAEGEKLLAAVRRLAKVHEGKDGELTGRGAGEHRRIASRMAERFPEAFESERIVHCRATPVHRVVESMENFVASLKETAPWLTFETASAPEYERLFCEPVFLKREKPALRKRINAAVGKIAGRELKPDALVNRIFTDADDIKDKVRFARDLFYCASDCQCVSEEAPGLDLYRFFTPEEITSNARVLAAEIYANMGNTEEFGDGFKRVTVPLVRDIIDRVDADIAGGGVAADLRFGHDNGIWPLAALMGIRGLDSRVPLSAALTECPPWKAVPMAANMQMVFYRNAENDVLVKILYNECEVKIRRLEPVSGPYYSWTALKDFLLGRIERM